MVARRHTGEDPNKTQLTKDEERTHKTYSHTKKKKKPESRRRIKKKSHYNTFNLNENPKYTLNERKSQQHQRAHQSVQKILKKNISKKNMKRNEKEVDNANAKNHVQHFYSML